MYYKKCEICGRKSGKQGGQKRLFMAQLPLDENRCKQWVKIIGNEDLVYVPIEKLHTLKRVCGIHFEKKHFNRKGTRLTKSAVPTKNLKASPLPDAILHDFPCHVFVSTDISPEQKIGCEKNQIENQTSDTACSPEPFFSKFHIDHDYCNYPREKSMPKIKLHKRVSYNSPEPSPSSLSSPEPQKRMASPTWVSDVEIAPRKKKLIPKCKETIKSFKLDNIMKNIKSKTLKSLIKMYIQNQRRKPQSERYSSFEKALEIYKKSPKTYEYLRHMITLPSVKTLEAFLQKVELGPGISPSILVHLKKKAEKCSEKDKICVLIFDEIALQKHLFYNSSTDKVEGFVDLGEEEFRSDEIADRALVFMIQGVYKEIKHPVAYYFVKRNITSQSFAVIIKNVIKAITETGFRIISTVCSQSPTNIEGLNLLKSLGNTPKESNYFLTEDGTKIFIMFDIPHLFKSIRNNFLEGREIAIDGKRAKLSHLTELEEKNKNTLHLDKITPLHINTKYRSRRKVKLAAQLFSNTVAAILKLLSETYNDTDKGREINETAQVIELLDKLFDSTNGPASKEDIVKQRREIVSKKSNHRAQWREFKRIILTMHCLKSDSQLRLRNARCVQGYYTSLCSLEDIWKYAELQGFQYLNLRQLNQDALENLFGLIRQYSPTNPNLTCHHFTDALKSIIFTKFNTPVCREAISEEDCNESVPPILGSHGKRVPEIDQDKTKFPLLNTPDDPDELGIEERIFNDIQKDPTLIAGYLASVVLKNVRCEKCRNSLKNNNPDPNTGPTHKQNKCPEITSLTYPNLCYLVDSCIEMFEEDVRLHLHRNNICKHAVTKMLIRRCRFPWTCVEHRDSLLDRLLHLLFSLLIRRECHQRNQSFLNSEELSAVEDKEAQQQGTAK